MSNNFAELSNLLEGELKTDHLNKTLYATDASVYKMLPQAVCFPKSIDDLKLLINFATQNNTSLIPRTAGTSLAGQCVGKGIVVDLSKYFNKIISLDVENKVVEVEPGVIRDQLNLFLKDHQLFFAPNTSTSNFCMIGGMVGNNSSGTTSIRYGVTRDKVLSLDMLLSDGSLITIESLDDIELNKKIRQDNLEGKIYTLIDKKLSDPKIQKHITEGFPSKKVHRRNTGYAVDQLLGMSPYNPSGDNFNLSKLISGSEGTLGIITKIKLRIDPLPPKFRGMLVPHYHSVNLALKSVPIAMKHKLYSCELIDKKILDCTVYNLEQQKNRFFVQKDPEAILMLEVCSDCKDDLRNQVKKLKQDLYDTDFSYALVELYDYQVDMAIALRLAGLGLLGNLVGDEKSAACIEDTAVPLEVLADYIQDFQKIANRFNQKIVYYAHAGAGELHLRPIVNLKSREGKREFRELTKAVARLVKTYNGSLSGEHGDGIVRSEFIPLVLGNENLALFESIKSVFDPKNIFNPGKIVDPYPMDQNLRTEYSVDTLKINTKFDFSKEHGLLGALEKCNGAGNCRSIGPKGSLCPSYRATRDEEHTTRGRANVLREALGNPTEINGFNNQDAVRVLDLCLSCKACVSECPSSVDMATYKAEFMYQYNKINGVSIRTQIFGNITKFNKKIRPFRWIYNAVIKNTIISYPIKLAMGISPKRSLPRLYSKPVFRELNSTNSCSSKKVYLYMDEFNYFNEPEIIKNSYNLLVGLNYQVEVLPFLESGRAFISKGLLDHAKTCLEKVYSTYSELISKETPLIGIEPSAVYTFNDELIKLLGDTEEKNSFSESCLLIDAFLANEIRKERIDSTYFETTNRRIKIHGHCYQKALGNVRDTFDILNLPTNYEVTILNTGCCGMAGSFGYEKEHYDISMKIGSDRLFPAIEKSEQDVIISANGTSCRHQIYDGTKRSSLHPVCILWKAFRKDESM